MTRLRMIRHVLRINARNFHDSLGFEGYALIVVFILWLYAVATL